MLCHFINDDIVFIIKSHILIYMNLTIFFFSMFLLANLVKFKTFAYSFRRKMSFGSKDISLSHRNRLELEVEVIIFYVCAFLCRHMFAFLEKQKNK